MVFLEPSFPRGCNKVVKPRRRYYGCAVEKCAQPSRLRPKDRRRALLDEQEQQEEIALHAYNLTWETLQEGMLVLGCVQHIFPTELVIALPGRISGNVPVSAISNTYAKRLAENEENPDNSFPLLSELYNIGELVYVKVMSKHPMIRLSLNPIDLHSEFTANQLVYGLVLAATIVAEEDHGFLMETGVPHVRAFLPHKHQGATVGENVVCSVEKVAQLDGTSATLILKAFTKAQRWKLQVDMVNIDTVVPGCVIPFTVDTPVEEGLCGTLFDDTLKAFVNRCMLATPMSKPEDYSMFQQESATLLYVFPLTKQVFVSLAPYPHNKVKDVQQRTKLHQLKVIENAHIVDVASYGVWFHFNKHRAILPRRTIMKGMKPNCNYEDTIRLGKYHVGSVHTLVPLRYDLFDRSFVVCDDIKNAVDITLPDVQVGQTYYCKIKSTNESGGSLTVQVGQTSGLVPKHFLDRKTSPKVGSIVPMVAVAKNETLVTFTNRPEFTRTNAKVLSDWDQLGTMARNTFVGVVVKERKEEFEVEFFNNVRGTISKHAKPEEDDVPRLKMLKCGTVAEFIVKKFQIGLQNPLKLRLPLPTGCRRIDMKVATVTTIHPHGVEVQLDNTQLVNVAAENFSVFSEHNPIHMSLIKKEQSLCVVEVWPGTGTVRDVRYLQYKPSSVSEVKVGDILRASCHQTDDNVKAQLLLADYTKLIKVGLFSRAGLSPQQVPNGKTIMMKVKAIKENTAGKPKLVVSSVLEDVCPNGVDNVVSYMMDYMEDVINLIGRFKLNGEVFATYNIGQEISLTVESVLEDSDEIVVNVHNDLDPKTPIKGIALKPSTNGVSTSCSVGETLNGRIVWVDVEQKLLRVCIDPELLRCIGENEWKLPDEPSQATEVTDCQVLFRNTYLRVCCTPQGAHPLVLVPARHHYNDLETYEVTHERNLSVILLKKFGPLLFGMQEEAFHRYCEITNASKAVKLSQKTETKKKNSKSQQQQSSKPDKAKKRQTKTEKKTEKTLTEGGRKLIKNSKRKIDAATVGEGEKPLKKKQKKQMPFVIDQLDGCENDYLFDQLDGAGIERELPSKKAKGKGKRCEGLSSTEAEVLSKKVKVFKRTGKGGENLLDAEAEVPSKMAKASKRTKQDKQEDKERNGLSGDLKKLSSKKAKGKGNLPEVPSKETNGFKRIEKDEEEDEKRLFDVERKVLPRKKKGKGKQSNELVDVGKNLPPKKAKVSKRSKNGDVEQNGNLPGAINFWNNKPIHQSQFNSSDVDADSEEGGQIAETKKWHRAEPMKWEEERLRAMDGELEYSSDEEQKSQGLLGANNFWDSTPVYERAKCDSSDEDEKSGENKQIPRTKNRLTAKERFEAMKREEERLRKIEEELADPSKEPRTPEQFDRLLLAQPNNSMLWIRYMAFHMETSDLNKARAVARKALKSINFREEADLLNVWMALLNLEIRYESVDSFKEVLQEAIQYNDAFKVYTRVLDILIDCQKEEEVRELLELLQKKFRKQNDMWHLVADAWYRIGKGGKVKPLLSQALKSLPSRDHISLIVKFAFLHQRHGNRDESHLLFEQILTSYPKRTDIWSQYVDMLVKDGLLENARQILERAVVQRLPLKNMKTLFTKYVSFEEKHGDRDRVRRVKEMASYYVQTQLNNAGVQTARAK